MEYGDALWDYGGALDGSTASDLRGACIGLDSICVEGAREAPDEAHSYNPGPLFATAVSDPPCAYLRGLHAPLARLKVAPLFALWLGVLRRIHTAILVRHLDDARLLPMEQAPVGGGWGITEDTRLNAHNGICVQPHRKCALSAGGKRTDFKRRSKWGELLHARTHTHPTSLAR